MSTEERFETASVKMDELKAKIEEVNKALKESIKEGAANFKSLRARIGNLQDKINDLSQAYAKADQEELIIDLLDYADDCRETAIEMAEEAILAYKAAAEQIALYNEKYGR